MFRIDTKIIQREEVRGKWNRNDLEMMTCSWLIGILFPPLSCMWAVFPNRMLREALGLQWYWVSLQLGVPARRPHITTLSGSHLCPTLHCYSPDHQNSQENSLSQPFGWVLGIGAANDAHLSARWLRRPLFRVHHCVKMPYLLKHQLL